MTTIDELVDEIIHEHNMGSKNKIDSEDNLRYKKYIDGFFEKYHGSTKQKDLEDVYNITTHPNFLLIPCLQLHSIYYRLYKNDLYCIDTDDLYKIKVDDNVDIFAYLLRKNGYYQGYSYYHNKLMYFPYKEEHFETVNRIYESKIFMGSLLHCKKIYKKSIPSWRIV